MFASFGEGATTLMVITAEEEADVDEAEGTEEVDAALGLDRQHLAK